MNSVRIFTPKRTDDLHPAAQPWIGRKVTVVSWHDNVTMRDKYPEADRVGFVREMSLDIPESELVVFPPKPSTSQTSFYVVAETVCPKCKGACRHNKQSRVGEPDYCDECTGHGLKAQRVDLKVALAELGVPMVAAAEETNDCA